MKHMSTADLWFKERPPEEREQAVRDCFREVFDNEKGAIVLASILDDLYYTREAKDERQIALRNYATFLLRERIGVTNDSLAVTTALLNIGIKEHTNVR